LSLKEDQAFLVELEIDGDNKDNILIIEGMDFSKLKVWVSKILVRPLRFEKADGALVTVFVFYE